MPTRRDQADRTTSVFTVPKRLPYSAAEFKMYKKKVAETGGEHDGFEIAPAQKLYYWWAFYKGKEKARKGVAELKKLGFQSSLSHPAPMGSAKASFPPNMGNFKKRKSSLKKKLFVKKSRARKR